MGKDISSLGKATFFVPNFSLIFITVKETNYFVISRSFLLLYVLISLFTALTVYSIAVVVLI